MKKGIIITSFGTSIERARRLSIDPIENKAIKSFEDFLVLKAFTSNIIISGLRNKGDWSVYNLAEALEKMKENSIRNIYIQPLLIIKGHEYNKIRQEAGRFLQDNSDFSIEIGQPLLGSLLDYEDIFNALELEKTRVNEALIFMGHGSGYYKDAAYNDLEKYIQEKGYSNLFIASLDGENNIEKISSELLEKNINSVSLKPFMLVAGRHAIKDMASDDEKSWKSILEKNNIKVKIHMEGLGQLEGIQDIFMGYLEYMINSNI